MALGNSLDMDGKIILKSTDMPAFKCQIAVVRKRPILIHFMELLRWLHAMKLKVVLANNYHWSEMMRVLQGSTVTLLRWEGFDLNQINSSEVTLADQSKWMYLGNLSQNIFWESQQSPVMQWDKTIFGGILPRGYEYQEANWKEIKC